MAKMAKTYDLTTRRNDIQRFAERSALETRRDSLYERLEEGYGRIERGLDEGRDITTWEDLWLSLLNEYEAVCDQLQRDLAA
jgi:hypothetical protein